MLSFRRNYVSFQTGMYKQQCRCQYCVKIDFYQAALNQYRQDLFVAKRDEWIRMPQSNASQKRAKTRKKKELLKYRKEAFGTGDDIYTVPPSLHKKPHDALASVQCEPPAGFADIGLCKIDCALQECKQCPEYKRAELEKKLDDDDRNINFYSLEGVLKCSACGPVPEGETECPTCKQQKVKPGKLSNREQVVFKSLPFQEFWDEYYMVELSRYRMHYWKMIVLSKQFMSDLREEAIEGSLYDVLIGHDFTDALCLTQNMECQSGSFGGNAASKVSIEGYTVAHNKVVVEGYTVENHPHYDYAIKLLDFHSFLSDSRIQEARTVLYHLTDLVQKLRDQGKLKERSRVLCVTDGCIKVIYFFKFIAN